MYNMSKVSTVCENIHVVCQTNEVYMKNQNSVATDRNITMKNLSFIIPS